MAKRQLVRGQEPNKRARSAPQTSSERDPNRPCTRGSSRNAAFVPALHPRTDILPPIVQEKVHEAARVLHSSWHRDCRVAARGTRARGEGAERRHRCGCPAIGAALGGI